LANLTLHDASGPPQEISQNNGVMPNVKLAVEIADVAMEEGVEVDGFGHRPARESNRSPLPVPAGDLAAVRFVVDTERRLVIARFGKRLSAPDIQEYVQKLCAHPHFDRSFSEIADISEVEELALEGPDFLKLADRTDPFSLESRRAFVAQTSVQKHAARMHKILRSQRNFEIFETLQQAEAWITS
jgi:hypothetical protein